MHTRLDITHWKSTFPLARLRESPAFDPDIGMLSQPFDIALLEQLRDETYASCQDVERRPTDIFVWRPGEGEHRAATKIGGLPYRAAGKPWPLEPSGVPLNFVAQICFVDSRDLVPTLPGDVMLVFAEGSASSYNGDTMYNIHWGNGLVFEWSSLGDFALQVANEVPPLPWHVRSCYGDIHRTCDYANIDNARFGRIAMDIPPVTEATKIGGLCPWINESDYCRLDTEIGIPGIYLCTLASITFGTHRLVLAHPPPSSSMHQREHQVAEGSTRGENQVQPLMIADAGLLNFFLDSTGMVRWTAHCQT